MSSQCELKKPKSSICFVYIYFYRYIESFNLSTLNETDTGTLGWILSRDLPIHDVSNEQHWLNHYKYDKVNRR
jgi:hypothetical protein